MGARGPGARPLTAIEGGRNAPPAPAFDFMGGQTSEQARPWHAPGLSRAERVIAFIESLPVTKGFGVGEPIKLLPFQLKWIEAVYAEGDDAKRLVREAMLSVARGNGKTVLIAGLCLAHLIGPESEPRGECYSAAATKEQAAIIFEEMAAWIRRVPWMNARCNVKAFHKTIDDAVTGSVYRALASDGASVHGLASSFVACDELAQWPKRELYDVLRTSMGKREEPLLIAIGTQSPYADNMMSELVDYAARVESGEIEDPGFHGQVYAAPEDAALDDPDAWAAANPALGLFRSREELASECARAMRMPTREAAFRNLYLNQRVDAEPKAINPAEWASCGGPVDVEALRGRPCYGGLDLSSTRDLTAFVLYFPEEGVALVWFWCPKHGLRERAETDRVPYDVWAKEGFITPTPGKAVDKAFIATHLAQLRNLYDIRGIAYDRWRIEELTPLLKQEGVELPLEPWGQNFASMAPAVDAFEQAMLSGHLKHADHPVLRWNASNAVYEQDASGNRKLNKARSRDRIDGLQALVMAIGLASQDGGPEEFQGGVIFI
jgi:phage terminase large subunit-like protein